MKVFVKKVSGILLIITGLIAFLFFRNYHGELIPYPTMWLITGIVLVFIGFFLEKSAFSSGYKKSRDEYKEEIEALKSRADKIRVDLNSCVIMTNKYTQQVDKVSSSRAMVLDALYDSGRNVENVNVTESVLMFETDKYGQKEQYFSPAIHKDEITLRFLLDRQKETYIYVDKDNRDNYYFDLEFLS